MLSKKEIKDIQSLGHKKNRDELGCFLAEGPKMVAEFIQLLPESIVKIYAVQEWIRENESKLKQLPVQEISPVELVRLSQMQTPHQVLCILKQSDHKEPVVKDAFSIYLDAIQDPGNLGTIIRIADWFGINQVICTPGCADCYNPKVVQASMASIARVSVFYDEAAAWLKSQTEVVYAAVLNGKPLYDFKKATSGILLIGNESRGISNELLKLATEKLTIPKKGNAESLNAAVATGIILSHLIA